MFILLLPARTALAEPGKFELAVGGYAETHFNYYDHGPDQTQPGGSPSDRRATFDTTRLAVELEGELEGGVEFEAEVEFEHGGTGSALDLEYEEFGEYENEVQRGGEVTLEELYVQKKFGDWLSLRAGRFYVAVGLLSTHRRPTDYLGTARPESETTVLPAVWDEIGAEARFDLRALLITLQVVNGLDSTGFSSQRWIASGHQTRFEETRATDVAGVLRVDLTAFEGMLVGGSAYFGDTTGNRPKPDMEDTSAPVLIVDGHLSVDLAPVRSRSVLIWGQLKNAAEISQKNRSLSNELGVLRTPVADQALATWSEVGIDVSGPLGLGARHRLEPFARFEYYDTMFSAGAGRFDNPRFARAIYSTGLAYTYRDSVVTKLGWIHRRLGSSAFRKENTLSAALGLLF